MLLSSRSSRLDLFSLRYAICLSVIFLQINSASAIVVNQLGATATQIILSYVAPDSTSCTITVYDDANQLVHDVDQTLFSGANKDTSRPGSIIAGTKRIVVIGKRATERAADGKLYSRALQTYTNHSFTINCNGSSATGNFTTQNIPLGNTYNEPFPVDRNNPGQYAWPTLDLADKNQRIVDPQTGLLIRPFVTRADGSPVAWTPGSTNFCSPKIITDGTGKQGALCAFRSPGNFQPTLYFIGVDGEARIIGEPYTYYAWNNLPEQYCVPGIFFDSEDPRIFRCLFQNTGVPTDPNRGYIMVKGRYVGDFRAADPSWHNGEMPICEGNVTSSCIEWSFVTAGPPAQSTTVEQLLRNRLTSVSLPSGQFATLVGIQSNRYWLFDLNWSGQDSQGWLYVADEQQKQIIASTGTYNQPPNGLSRPNPLRWCALHAQGPSALDNWFKIATDPLNGSPGRPGFGPYIVNIVSGGVNSNFVTCPNNIYGRSGEARCSVVTVDGEPRNPSPQNDGVHGEIPFTPTAVEGDVVAIQPTEVNHYEYMRLIKKTGNTWTLLRKLGQEGNWTWDHTGVTTLYMGCGGFNQNGSPPPLINWNYLSDPNATNASGNTIILEAEGGGHFSESNGYIVRAFYTIDKGPLQQSWVGSPQTQYIANAAPPFAGITGISVPAYTDLHPSSAMEIQTGEVLVIDGRPFNFATNNPRHGNIPGNNVTGDLYHLTSNAYGGYPGVITSVDWDPQSAPVFAYCGDKVLADVSAAGASMTGGSSAAYTYCLARHAGECWLGSHIGDLYVNCPGLTSTTCDGSSAALCVGQNGGRLGTMPEGDVSKPDPDGVRSRALTQGFGRFGHQDLYWNASWVPGSTGPSAFIFNVPNPNGTAQTQLYIGKLPPFPAFDNIARNDYMPVTYPVAKPTIADTNNVVVQFGYRENGLSDQFFCTTRKDPCIKGSQAGNRFDYSSDETIAGVSCANGCNVTIPAIPQRILYFQVIYRDAANHVLGTDGIRTVATEPPYNFSGSGDSLAPNPPKSLRALN